jgi:DNA gyrase/topoisomerase IV subunit B
MSIGRDANKYGILMLRGKCKNLLNCTIEEGLQNEEVKLFQQALGVIYGRKTPESQLRYGKIAIASDSDFDGSHIGLLILAMAHIICPNFLTENRIYWLRSPLFIEQDKTGKPLKCWYTDEEFDKARSTVKGNVKRVKGLGQLNERDLKATMFSPTEQKMDQIMYSEEGIHQLCQLMGPDIKPRKEFVFSRIDFSKF